MEANSTTNVTAEAAAGGGHSLHSVDIVIYCVQWLVALVGVLGNALVLYVYALKRPKAPSERFIIVIAATDLCMNASLILFTITRVVYSEQTGLPFCLLSNAVYDIVNTSSGVLVCGMTVNRYVAVCRPHSYNSLFTSLSVNLFLAFTFVLALLLTAPGGTLCLLYYTEIGGAEYRNPGAGEVDVAKVTWVVIRSVMLAVAGVLMAVLYHRVRRALLANAAKKHAAASVQLGEKTAATNPADHTQRVKHGGAKGDENQNLMEKGSGTPPVLKRSARGNSVSKGGADNNLTLVLFVISVCYVLFMLPDVLVNLIDSFNFFSSTQSFERVRIPVQIMFSLNFITNPFIYLVCNNYFKTEVRKLLKL